MGERKFCFGSPCPHCSGNTEWLPNVVQEKKDEGIEFGRFRCKKCGAVSDWHEITISFRVRAEEKT